MNNFIQHIKINPKISGRLTTVIEGEIGPPDLSSDGSTVSYSKRVGETGDIYLRDKNGERAITNTPEIYEFNPKLNSNGSAAAYDIFVPKSRNFDVGVWNGTENHIIASSPFREESTDISEDGTTVVYSVRRGNRQSSVQRWNDGQTSAVAIGLNEAAHPQVSDSRFAWVDKGDIHLRDQDDNIKNLTQDNPRQMALDMSSDGKVFAYTQSSDGRTELFTKDIENDITVQITDTEHPEHYPNLSANGEHLVWVDGEKGNWKIMKRDGDQNLEIASSTSGISSSPAISDDGNSIVWWWTKRKGESHERAIFRLDLDQ